MSENRGFGFFGSDIWVLIIIIVILLLFFPGFFGRYDYYE